MLAVNVGGNRGILSEITMDGMNNAIKQIEAGNIILEKRTRVIASFGGKEFAPALNEILTAKKSNKNCIHDDVYNHEKVLLFFHLEPRWIRVCILDYGGYD